MGQPPDILVGTLLTTSRLPKSNQALRWRFTIERAALASEDRWISLLDRRAIPAGAAESDVAAPGTDSAIRRIDWPAAGPSSRGSILFMPGRGDAYEKYLEDAASSGTARAGA